MSAADDRIGRVEELLEANNRYLQEARDAREEVEQLREALVRIRDLTPSAANVDTAQHMHNAVRAIAVTALTEGQS